MHCIYKNNHTFVSISIYTLFAEPIFPLATPSAIYFNFPTSHSALPHHPFRRFQIFDSQC